MPTMSYYACTTGMSTTSVLCMYYALLCLWCLIMPTMLVLCLFITTSLVKKFYMCKTKNSSVPRGTKLPNKSQEMYPTNLKIVNISYSKT